MTKDKITLTKDKINIILKLYSHINGVDSIKTLDIEKFITNKENLTQLLKDATEYIGILNIQLKDSDLNQAKFNEVSGTITIVSAQIKLLEYILSYEKVII